MKRNIKFIAIVFCLSCCKHYVENSGYIEISKQSNLILDVQSFSNNRGYGIINEKYWLPSNSKIKGNESQIKDLILKNYLSKDYIRPTPRISDLKVPYTIYKNTSNKKIIVIKEQDTIAIELTN